MFQNIKMAVLFILLLIGVSTPTLALDDIDDKPSVGAILGDLLFARPILFATTQIGSLFYTLSLPLTLLNGDSETVAETLVVTPAQATYTRCLGCVGANSKAKVVSSKHFVMLEGSYNTFDYSNAGKKAGSAIGWAINMGTNFKLTDRSRFDVYLAAKKKLPNLKVCFDEEVKSMGDVIKLHKLGVLDELNLKVGRVGGITNSIEILQYCYEHQIPCWIGGMFETGIGRLLNLQFASYLPKAAAHDLSPSQRYFMQDIIDPDVMGLQETKVHDEQFPLKNVESLGYHVEYFGQKAHYGVALLSKVAPIFVQKGFRGEDKEAQKRFIHARYVLKDARLMY